MMAVNVSLICLILTCSLKYHSNRDCERQPYLHQTVNGKSNRTDGYGCKRATNPLNPTADANDRTKNQRGFTGLMKTATGPTGNTVVPLWVSTVRHKYGHRTGTTLDTISLQQEQRQSSNFCSNFEYRWILKRW